MWSQLQTYLNKIMYHKMSLLLVCHMSEESKPSFTYCCYMMLSYVTTTIVLHHHVSSLVDVRYCGVWCIQEHVFHCPSSYWQTVGGVLGFYLPPTNQRSEHSNFNCCLLKWGSSCTLNLSQKHRCLCPSVATLTHDTHSHTNTTYNLYSFKYSLLSLISSYIYRSVK